ncbi:hypothetical protein WN944_003423 [Citrus x changshan-huyou]|uniref:Uncharacterized protein n=1 Tax=Citrus x changshan-huyou TaxID=2935761 RepID=A0AAP0LYK4_9ROSI
MAENVDEGNENDFKENDNSINLSPRDFEYIMGIKDGGVIDIDDIDKLRDEYWDDSGYIKLKTLESKLVNQREFPSHQGTDRSSGANFDGSSTALDSF